MEKNKKKTSFLLSEEARRILDDLEEKLGVNKVAVVELSLRAFHKDYRGEE